MTFVSTRHDISFCLTVSLLIIIAITFTLSGYSGLKASYAQSATSSNFKLYQNLPIGFSIQYPSEWQVEEDTSADEKKLTFLTADSFPIFTVRVKAAEQYLDTNTMTLKNQTLEQAVQDHLNLISQPNPWGEFNIIRQNEVTVGGQKGWKVESSVGTKAKQFLYLFEILTIANGKLYTLDYNEHPLNVPETLPIVNKMVESFQFIR